MSSLRVRRRPHVRQRTPVSRTLSPQSACSQKTARLQFKPSPFYEVLEALANTVELHRKLTLWERCVHMFDMTALAMPSNRHTVAIRLLLSDSQCRRLKDDNSLRIMVYCAADAPTNAYMQLDIAFPHQVEIKVNDEEVKANLRGLKNKPGSTRPADITELVRKIPNYNNSMSVTYALTPKVRSQGRSRRPRLLRFRM